MNWEHCRDTHHLSFLLGLGHDYLLYPVVSRPQTLNRHFSKGKFQLEIAPSFRLECFLRAAAPLAAGISGLNSNTQCKREKGEAETRGGKFGATHAKPFKGKNRAGKWMVLVSPSFDCWAGLSLPSHNLSLRPCGSGLVQQRESLARREGGLELSGAMSRD